MDSTSRARVLAAVNYAIEACDIRAATCDGCGRVCDADAADDVCITDACGRAGLVLMCDACAPAARAIAGAAAAAPLVTPSARSIHGVHARATDIASGGGDQ